MDETVKTPTAEQMVEEVGTREINLAYGECKKAFSVYSKWNDEVAKLWSDFHNPPKQD